jgi:uncharacterized membrane protein SpoIIM required for sporulation
VTPELILFLAIVLVAGAAGVAIGILLIGPRLDRWAERHDEEADGKRD